MDRKLRVLVVDDLQEWQEQLVEALKDNGFYARSAPDADRAFKILEEDLFHILILDIRMNDKDHTNVDGINMLVRLEKLHWNEAIKVLMLSAYGTREQMRSAFRDYDVADFVSKDDLNSATFLENVQRVFERGMRVNLKLEIQWEQESMIEQVVRHLEGNGNAMRHTVAFRRLLTTELDDLLCRLFHTAQGVVVKPFTPGHSGSGILRVLPYFPHGGSGREVIVKVGHLQNIVKEHENFSKFVAPYVGGGRSTAVLDMRYTPHLGAIVYSLLGTASENIESMRHFYQHAALSEIKKVVYQLFWQTCGSWYASRSQLHPYNLTQEYQRQLGYTHKELEQAVAQLKSVQGKERLYFERLTSLRNFVNPLQSKSHPPFIHNTYECITHGDFNPDNLFVDEACNSWLIDFQNAGTGHILHDVATLDAVVRYQLLKAEEATLDERLAMEDALCSIDHFSQLDDLVSRFLTQNQQLAKAYALVLSLRTVASRMVEHSANDRLDEYYVALLYIALNTLRFSSLAEVQREHALLSASLLFERLEQLRKN